ncbi:MULTISPECIES: WecB/TagA/CpsF family glycosyltransferase [Thiorhodovibrio]|uniref:WecB/TagA/CpsF family glycosyltransferase n=1 Tax=Thiorhodovibrio TaxID=61593 RepID=UPI001912AEAC|nr:MULTISPECIES: WecB/TagA/CpsF family glycosyltransferase [Thiorhodovibrio]WPL11022.1 Putative N-acetylmannosaminyltransferase [Thiorhodovibrio litoralis]
MNQNNQPSGQVTLILGIPVDDLTPELVVERTLALIAAYRRDGRARQIVTVNVDFLTNALGWTPWSAPRHPELLEILRRADLVTADGMPVVWLARLLGTPLRGRVTGADLVPALAAALARSGQSLYLLGGRGEVGQQAADKLVAEHPDLRIAGVHSPFVQTEGEAMLLSDEEDAEIVARINAVEPDVLLIGFGNPKQEIWFHRNRHRLKAGVSIGIGGTFEFIVGRVARAPVWMQRTGLEWIWRISQDPKRLWKRYAVGFAKLGVMTVPLVAHYHLQRRLQGLRQRWRKSRTDQASADRANPDLTNQTRAPAPQQDATLAADAAAASRRRMLLLPEVADAAWVKTQQPQADTPDQAELVVDFTQVRFLDSSALGYLARLWKSRQNAGAPVRAEGLERTPAASLLKMTRTWDLFKQGIATVADADQPVANQDPQASKIPGIADWQFSLAESPDIAIAMPGNRLDADRARRLDLDALAAQLGNRHLLLDLSDLAFIDSTGLGALFRLQRKLQGHDRRLLLCAPQPAVRQLLDITRLTALFELAANREQALRRLETA